MEDSIAMILMRYDGSFRNHKEWNDGNTLDRIEWLCRMALRVADDGFQLQPEPRRDEYIAAINRWYKRRASTKWTPKETRSLKAVLDLHTTDDEFKVLDRYYSANIPISSDYRRRDVVTLLNNWSGEIDRARKWSAIGSMQSQAVRV